MASRFVVNFDDPEDVQAKLKVARERVAEIDAWLEALDALRAEKRLWTSRVNGLSAAFAPPARLIEVNNVGALVVDVVIREARPIRARDVRGILVAEGHGVSGEQVSNALLYAARTGKLTKAGRGTYAPPERLGGTE